MKSLSFFFVSLFILFFSVPADAWVCSRIINDDKHPELGEGPSLAWASREINFTLAHEGTDRLPDDRERQVLRASWAEWNNIIGCAPDLSTSDFQFIETEYVSGSQRVGFNALIPSENENISLFYDQDWPHGGSSCSIIALTTVTYKAQNGEIIDADIEYNSEYCGFTIVGELSSSDPVDLMNTAVHEIGHVVGLGHSTNSLSTMYPQAFGNETHKRDLACDDKTGIVFKYPTQMENGYCDPPNAECGYCAPPDLLERIPEVKVISRDDGEGCNCQNNSGAYALLFIILSFSRRRLAQAFSRQP